ncbi:MAG: CocE/NonD family hydrolase [Crocinitomicaceae bacterium]
MKFNLILAALLVSLGSFAQLTPTFDDISIPMRDGEVLSADVYIPAGADSCEVILIQTPYDKNLFEASMPLGIGLNLDSQPYAFVIVDWRGFYGSSGADLSNFERGEDGYDIIDWIVQQPWHLNNVGTWGPSALGGVQYQTAREQHPNHTCAIPVVAHPEQAYESYFYGGCLEEARLYQLDALGYGLSPVVLANPYMNSIWQFSAANSWYPSDIHIPTLQIGGWYDHNISRMMDWYEATRNSALSTVQDEQWLLVGPWVHGGTGIAFVGSSIQGELTYPNAEYVNNDMALDFFDYYLLGAANGWDLTDKITYYNMGDDTWLSSNATTIDLPLNDVLYLNDNGILSSEDNGLSSTSFNSDPNNPSPTIGGATLSTGLDQGPYDQVALDARNDVITFQSGVLYADASISGEAVVDLNISSDQPDCDIVVRLVDVYPDNRSMLINDGIQRVRFRNGYSQGDESFMTPGQVYNVQVTLPFTNYTWKAGHRIKIYISGNSDTRWNVNLQDGGTMYQPGTGNVANITIHHDQNNSSYILLPGSNSSLSTQELNEKPIRIYPNPAAESVNIEGATNPSYILYDAKGQIILEDSGNQLNTQAVASGWYLLQINGDNVQKQLPVIIR